MTARAMGLSGRSIRVLAVSCLLAGLATLASPAPAGDQPQWGQRHSRNMVSDEKSLPETFDPKTGRNVKWSAPLGTETHSTPVVASGKVLIGTNNARPRDPRHKGDRGVLMCFGEKDGTFCWQLAVPKLSSDPYLDWPHTGICSPPTVEGDRVYCVSNRGEVMCLDLHGMANGNDGPYRDEAQHAVPKGAPPIEAGPTGADILWLYDVAAELGVHQHDAAHCSPLLDGQLLWACTSNGVDNTHKRILAPDAPSLIVLDKATGRLVACDAERIGPRIIHCTWSSPALGEVGGRPLVFFGGGDGLCYAFDAVRPALAGPPAKLTKVWWFDCDPAGPKEDIFRYQDNRQEGPSNISGMPVFHQGRVYVAAGGDLWHGKRQSWLKCIDAAKSGDVTRSGEVWSYPLKSHCMSTPAIHGGLVYITDCGRTVHCLDAETGRPRWTHAAKGEIWSSPLVADGKVYVTTRRGEVLVFAAGPEKNLLSAVELGEPISASPVAANGVLYITTMSRLYALQKTRE